MRLPKRGFTVLRYRYSPEMFKKSLASFTEGCQFGMHTTHLMYRGEVKTYTINPEKRKLIVSLKWLCMKDISSSSEWAGIDPNDLELTFSIFYLQEEDRLKVKTWKRHVVGHFYKPNDPTNITPS